MRTILFVAACAFTSFIQAQPNSNTIPGYPFKEQQRRSSLQLMPNYPFVYFDTLLKKARIYTAETGAHDLFEVPSVSKAIPQRTSTTSNFMLVKDINASKDANPYNFNYDKLTPSFAVLNNISYYSADNGINGKELWRSDGTPAGTFMVKDINPGEASSDVVDIITANNRLFFMAFTPLSGFEVWNSDGTENGTVLLKDIQPGSEGSEAAELTNVNGRVFFIYHAFAAQSQLWVSDGNESGTQIVSDLNYNGVYSQYPTQLTAVNNLLFFTAYSTATGYELYRSDGTEAGTYLVKDINSTSDYNNAPQQLTSYKNKLYFSADNGSGRVLWVSDGTSNHTNPAPGNNDVILQSTYSYGSFPFPISNGKLFFPGFTNATGWELFKYDGSAAGVSLVKNITPGAGNTNLLSAPVLDVANTVYFIFRDSASEVRIWKSNGKTSGTEEVMNLGKADCGNFFSANNQLLFNRYTDSTGYELWRSDGTRTGTHIVKDIYQGATSSNPYFNTNCNGITLFAANSSRSGIELWKTDGTFSGTTLVKDANKTSSASSTPDQITPLNNSVLFTAFKRERGNELWRSDGTQAGTSLVKDIVPGESSYLDIFFTTKNNLAYFTHYTYPGNAIYSTDGTEAGTKKIVEIPNGYVQGYVVTDNGNIFYYIYNFVTSTYQLWRTDGTVSGNILLKDSLSISHLFHNFNTGIFNGIVSLNNTIYFSATDNPSEGFELWKSDGNPGGTSRVIDLYPGQASSNLTNLIKYNNAMYFSAFDGTNYFLWKSDGTTAHTVKLKAILPSNFCISNNTLFFNGYDYTTYQAELWKTDGTKMGTKIVKDINRGINSSNPYNLIDVNGLLYFTATDGSHGTELWTSDGSSRNTKLAKDITPGSSSTYINSLTGSSGKLFFVKDDFLWMSDGTDAGTHTVDDLGLADLTQIRSLKSAGNKLFFEAYTYRYGYELYAGNTSTLSFAKSAIAEKGTPVEGFNASLVNNPVRDQLEIKINTKNDQPAQIIITDMAGRKMTERNLSLSSGTNRFNYNTSSWQPGMYVIKIAYADGTTATLKAIK